MSKKPIYTPSDIMMFIQRDNTVRRDSQKGPKLFPSFWAHLSAVSTGVALTKGARVTTAGCGQ